ncbi:hypothetical protein JMJ35_002767 [Cladonia borealis]|uniref:DNA/RNA-binding domain-containing protein n=1 Tax=Cladonia borealis TaxID=184061 RepID=A0AA39R5S0_9LECA|nr:hypothetical protein JMJ35_002767 [Cladonia borealis]
MAPEMLLKPKTRSIRRELSCSTPCVKAKESPPQILQDDMCTAPEAQPEMLLQPETRPISHDQLVIEVKGIYAGLVMVEAKCIDIEEKTAAATEKDLPIRAQLKNDGYQSLIALHKSLLHDHHDFFLASQHPAASPALSRLAAKYSMPARMWRHGIHAFLEVLRHRLPESREHMLAFIYIAYSMMALLYETVPAYEEKWIDCLGDLGRYRMAIEDDDPKDREVWSNVARFWYNKAADNSPRVGRLYHHLAILARPYSLEQLSLYTRALTCVTPYESARGSIMTLFTPIINGRYTTEHRRSSLEIVFIKKYGIFSSGYSAVTGWNDYLEDYSLTKTSKFEENGICAAILTFAAATFEYASLRGRMLRFDGLEPLITTGTQFGSTTKHQLITTTLDVLRSALDQISHWKRRFTSNDKALGSVRWPPICAACKLRSSLALTLITCSNFVEPTAARTISRNTGNEESTDRIAAVVLPLAHWPCLVFVIIALLAAQYLAHMKDAIFVWGTMMTIWAFGWWTIRADSGTTLQISGMVLCLWAISAYQYGHAAFSKHRIPARAGIIIVISAMILDVSTVTLMTPSEASTAQSELLLSLSLPLVSLILAAMVNMVAAMQSAEDPHHLEAGLQVHVPFVQEQPYYERQQRRFRMPVEPHFRPVELPTTPSDGR